MDAHYFDTSDGLLARHSIAIRLRGEGKSWMQTLKFNGHQGVQRLEHEVKRDAGAKRPTLNLDLHAGSEAYEKLDEALRAGEDAVLVPVYQTQVVRHLRAIHIGSSVVELAFDEGMLIAARQTRPICELEFELKSGAAHALFELAALWASRHCLWLDVVSKAQRGDLLFHGRSNGEAVKATLNEIEDPSDVRAFARASIGSCLAQVLPNISAIADGSGDAEHIHQARIGLQRLRIAVTELAALDCGIDPGWEPSLAAVYRALGIARDRQLLETSTTRRLMEAGAPQLPSLPFEKSLASALVVRTADFQLTLLTALAFAMNASRAAGPAFDGTVIEALSGRLDHLHEELRHSAREFLALEAAQQHRVRKHAKRLRYLAEFVAPIFRQSKAKEFLEHLRPALESLGERNDDLIALQDYRLHGGDSPGAWFAVGWLTANRRSSAAEAAKALRTAGKAARFWRGKGKSRHQGRR